MGRFSTLSGDGKAKVLRIPLGHRHRVSNLQCKMFDFHPAILRIEFPNRQSGSMPHFSGVFLPRPLPLLVFHFPPPYFSRCDTPCHTPLLSLPSKMKTKIELSLTPCFSKVLLPPRAFNCFNSFYSRTTESSSTADLTIQPI